MTRRRVSFGPRRPSRRGDRVARHACRGRAGLPRRHREPPTRAVRATTVTPRMPTPPPIVHQGFRVGDRRARADCQSPRAGRSAARPCARPLRARRRVVALLPRPAWRGTAPHRDPHRTRRAQGRVASLVDDDADALTCAVLPRPRRRLPRRAAHARRRRAARASCRTRPRRALIADAMRYALAGGGKRLRPCLALAVADAVAAARAAVSRRRAIARAAVGACAVELVHMLFARPRRPARDGQRHAPPRAPDAARGLRRRHGHSGGRRPADRGVSGHRRGALARPPVPAPPDLSADRRLRAVAMLARRGRARSAWSADRRSTSRRPDACRAPSGRRSRRPRCRTCTRARLARSSSPPRRWAPSRSAPTSARSPPSTSTRATWASPSRSSTTCSTSRDRPRRSARPRARTRRRAQPTYPGALRRRVARARGRLLVERAHARARRRRDRRAARRDRRLESRTQNAVTQARVSISSSWRAAWPRRASAPAR